MGQRDNNRLDLLRLLLMPMKIEVKGSHWSPHATCQNGPADPKAVPAGHGRLNKVSKLLNIDNRRSETI